MSSVDLTDAKQLSLFKHDLRNQLSNIMMSLEGVKYETRNNGGDIVFYLQNLSESAQKMQELLDKLE